MIENYPRCKTCIHWVKHPNFGNEIICNSTKLDEGIGQSADKNKDMLIYEYDEGGSFYPGEDFGCVHHEPKQ